MSDGVFANLARRGRRVEHRGADHRRALRQPADQRGEAECAAERRAGQHAGGRPVGEGARHRRAVRQQGALVVQHELGPGSGAGRGEAQHAGVGLGGRRRVGAGAQVGVAVSGQGMSVAGGGGRLWRRQPGRRSVRRVDGDHAAQPRQGLGRHVVQDALEVDALEARPEDQPVGLAAPQDVGHFQRAETSVDRQRQRAQPRAGQEGFDPGGAVGQPDGHALARLQAQAREPGGQRDGARAQLGGADGAVRVDQQGARGIGGGQRIQVSGEGVGNSVGDGHGVH